jgi:acetaldehyde dehydrogenase (acetylating)
MTLGCGAVAGNSTSDNVSPLHLINIKRLAYARDSRPAVSVQRGVVDRAAVVSAVERYLAKRGVTAAPAPAPAAVPEPVVSIVEFVCEDDVRRAIRESRKIFVGPKTIITPSARDLANQHDTLVGARR